MATVSNSGGVTTQGNRTFYFGTSSGLDTSALIEAAYNQRIAPAVKNDDKIVKNTTRVSALSELQTLSKSVQTALASLRTSYSILSDPSAFNQKAGTLTTASTGITPASFLNVSIDSDAAAGNYSIQVSHLATAQKVRGGSYADAAAALSLDGTFSIGLSGGTTADIAVDSTMSLNDIAAAINGQTGTTNVSASVLQVSPGQYQLFLTAKETNKEIVTSVVAGTDILQSVGMTDGAGSFLNEVQSFGAAELVVDGVTFTRDSNSFSDVIDGVNFDLLTESNTVNFNLKIGNDNSAVKDRILDFVEAYNALRDFVLTNQAVASGGAVPEEAVLFGDNQLRSLTTSVQSLLAKSFGDGGTNLSTLRELGITQNGDGKLETDESKLDTAISTKFDQVKDIFSTQITNPNSNFRMSGNKSLLTSATMNFDITYSGGAITNVSVNGDSTLFDISGTSITGKAGTIYEGMNFAYVGTANATFTFSINQGLGDLLDNTLNKFSDTITGSLEIEKQRLNDINTDLEARSARIRERADDYRDSLINRYARFEAQIGASKAILAQIKAILGVKDND
jgi:flagellar hook-associated protein 2